MGGLFSGPKEEQRPQRTTTSFTSGSRPTTSSWNDQNSAYQSYYYETLRRQAEEERQRELRRQLEARRRQEEEQQRRRHHQQQLIPVSGHPLNRFVLQQTMADNWEGGITSNSSYRKVEVEQNTQEYRDIRNIFKTTTKKFFQIVKIERIQNPYLLGCYLLKKEEIENMYGSVVEEWSLFHGTKSINVDKICENNFNWRLHGGSTGNRFGKGVSFSPISYYASHYSDKNSNMKVMFLARVLVSYTTEGSGDMEIPPILRHSLYCTNTVRYDTTQKEDGSVIVKFSDSEYYPEYLIYYTGNVHKVNKRRAY